MDTTTKAPHDAFGAFVFSTRGFYLLAAQIAILWLKHQANAHIPLALYLGLLGAILLTQVFRTWAAGFVGTVARQPITGAPELLTAGPYAFVRNPMYLGNLVITTCLALLSGLWYGPLVAWVAYAGVYLIVIPYEERYLEARFGQKYRTYKLLVPRLFPTFHGYPKSHGVFRLSEGIANEVAAWIGIGLFAYLYAVL